MTHTSREQSPSKIWYGWQKTKAVASAFKHPKYKSDSRTLARTSGLSAAGFAVGATLWGWSAFLFFIPSAIAAGAGVIYGWQAIGKARYLANTPAAKDMIRAAEQKWREKKSAPGFKQRASAKIRRGVDKLKLALNVSAKWGSITAAVAATSAAGAGALQYFGVAQIIPATLVTALTEGTVATGAALGLGATAAVYGAVALAVLVIPVAALAGVVFHKRAQNIRARLEEETPAKTAKPVAKAAPKTIAPAPQTAAPEASEQRAAVNELYELPSVLDTPKPNTPVFNDTAVVKTPAPAAPQKSEAQQRLDQIAEERRAARARARGKGQQRF